MAGTYTRARAPLARKYTNRILESRDGTKSMKIVNYIERHNFCLKDLLTKSNRTEIQTYEVYFKLVYFKLGLTEVRGSSLSCRVVCLDQELHSSLGTVANGTTKNVGLRKFWQDLEILEAFLISLEVSFLHGLFFLFLSLETFYQRVSGSDF